KTNNLITKLTLLTAISAPLTIITGIYGMNFRYMPELNWIYGYPATLFFMLCIIFVGIIIFNIKKLL
uniref:CorA family divalent cation transporter n=1 Tax=Clostridioides difficile TaxID=1496 RepID=UPI00265CBA17